MLAGFHAMDEHFRTAPPARNLPLLLGFDGLYNIFSARQTIGIMPIRGRARAFPAYLQATPDGSNGKHVDLEGHPVDYQTGRIVWGEPGTDGNIRSINCCTRDEAGSMRHDRVLQAAQSARRQHDLLMSEYVRPGRALAFAKPPRN